MTNLFYAIFGAPHPKAPALASGWTWEWSTDPWGYAELTVYRPDGRASFQCVGGDDSWTLNANCGDDFNAYDKYRTYEQVLSAARKKLPKAFPA